MNESGTKYDKTMRTIKEERKVEMKRSNDEDDWMYKENQT